MGTDSNAERRQWAGQMARYGIASAPSGGPSTGIWKVVLDEYYWDRLERAHDLALELGVSFSWQEWFFRLIEAEAVTREISQTVDIDPQVSLEHVPAQLQHLHQ